MDKASATSSNLPDSDAGVDEHAQVQQLLNSGSWQKRLEEARKKREKVLAEQGASGEGEADLVAPEGAGQRPWETPSAGMANVLLALRQAQNHEQARVAGAKPSDSSKLHEREVAEVRSKAVNPPLKLTERFQAQVEEEQKTPPHTPPHTPRRAIVIASRDASGLVAPPVGNATRSLGEGKVGGKFRWGRIAFVITAFAFGLGLGLGLANLVAGLGGVAVTAKVDMPGTAAPAAAVVANAPTPVVVKPAEKKADPVIPEGAVNSAVAAAANVGTSDIAPQIAVTLATSVPVSAPEPTFPNPSGIENIALLAAPLTVAPQANDDVAPYVADPVTNLPRASHQLPGALISPKVVPDGVTAPVQSNSPDLIETARLTLTDEWDGQDLPLIDLTPVQPPAPASGVSSLLPVAQIKMLVPLKSVAENVDQVTDGLISAGYQLRDPITVNFTVSKNHVRYYHAADADVANALGVEIEGPVKDFTAAGSDAPVGTIEVWLAGSGGPSPTKKTAKNKAKNKAKRAIPTSGPTDAERADALRKWLISQMKQKTY